MADGDVDGVAALARAAYADRDNDLLGTYGITPWTEQRPTGTSGARVSAKRLIRHLLQTDPDTCFVVERGAGIAAAIAITDREDLCGLALLAVAPEHRGRGLAAVLYDEVRTTVENAARTMAVAGLDAHSVRSLFHWGFDVHPAMRAEGVVDRSRLVATPRVRDGAPSDVGLCESVDRRLRGATRGPDHVLLLTGSRLLVAEDGVGRGYAYVRPSGSPLTVAATQTSVARELLLAALAVGDTSSAVVVSNLTGEQRWAYDVVRRLGLDLHASGPVLVRGMALPSPYLAHDALC